MSSIVWLNIGNTTHLTLVTQLLENDDTNVYFFILIT